ncbi:MAG: hypothetical protein ACHQIL_12250 [Steroidobacterales bacterium]
MHEFKLLAITAIAAGGALAMLPTLATAQVSISIGAAPECPYGYYDVSPYNCAPSGYYGPEWFSGDVFIGAGPWFHGHDEFRGHVDNSYHPDHGYKGALPNRGEKAEPGKRVDPSKFKGNEERDGRGHETHGK